MKTIEKRLPKGRLKAILAKLLEIRPVTGRQLRFRLVKVIWHPSPNFDSRNGQKIVFLIQHYTVDDFEKALARLTDPAAQVSSHYLVDVDGTIYLLVAEINRAWHAAPAFWDGYTDINAVSIGIEIVNPGDAPYAPAQMEAVKALSLDIVERNSIPAKYVLAHSDVSVTPANHKSDPGWFFDWQGLALKGVGVWPQPTQVDYDSSAGWSDDDLKQKLMEYGYTADAELSKLVEAFQRHFQQEVAQTPERIGVADADTRARLAYLLRFKSAGIRLF
jgi:N-acetylmuramoyl-L-alanine amidase